MLSYIQRNFDRGVLIGLSAILFQSFLPIRTAQAQFDIYDFPGGVTDLRTAPGDRDFETETPLDRPFGVASQSWCLGMREQWISRDTLGLGDSVSIRQAMLDGKCSYWDISLPEPSSDSDISQ